MSKENCNLIAGDIKTPGISVLASRKCVRKILIDGYKRVTCVGRAPRRRLALRTAFPHACALSPHFIGTIFWFMNWWSSLKRRDFMAQLEPIG